MTQKRERFYLMDAFFLLPWTFPLYIIFLRAMPLYLIVMKTTSILEVV